MKKLFNTQKKRDAAIADFTSLKSNRGWILYEQVLDANIELCTQRILTKKDKKRELTNRGIDRERDKLAIYKELKSIPENKIKEFSAPEVKEPNPDPFHTAESLQEEHKKVTES